MEIGTGKRVEKGLCQVSLIGPHVQPPWYCTGHGASGHRSQRSAPSSTTFCFRFLNEQQKVEKNIYTFLQQSNQFKNHLQLEK